MPEPARSYDRLSGWGAIVTGAGSLGEGVGTGKAIAILLAREGARVALFDLDHDRAAETRRQIAEQGGEAEVFTGDVTDAEACTGAVAAAVAWLGRLDILVNNVGMGAGAGRLEAIEPDAWERGVALNLGSAFNMTRAAMPSLLASEGKAVVNIASVAGVLAHGTASYGPAKAAMIQLTREIAVMYGREGLRANAVLPGHIMTPLVEKFASPDARETRRLIAPLGIEGDAWDVAQAVLFLAGPEARFVSGAILPVDGGVTQIAPLAAYEALVGVSMTR